METVQGPVKALSEYCGIRLSTTMFRRGGTISVDDCWQFHLSPSDLKHIDRPDWMDPVKGEPTLMLFSVVDDRSGTT